MNPIHEETELIDGYHSSSRSKTVINNGMAEMFFVLLGLLLVVPIAALILGGSLTILREIQKPPRCSEVRTTRYAVELGRFGNG